MELEAAGRERIRFWTTVSLLAILSFALHLAVNALGGYGYFRDELYYIACSHRLAAGYVDHPPFSIFALAGARLLWGSSIFAIRLVPALLSALSIGLLGLLVRRLGGGRSAVTLAALAFIASPQLLATHSYYSMNGFDILFWLLAIHLLLMIQERGGKGLWLGLGLTLGLGLLNKTSVLWLGAGIAAAVLLTETLRPQLKTPGPYTAFALALVVFSPFLIWNALHGWPHLEFMHNAVANKYATLTRSRFLLDQVRAMNPSTFLLSIPGLLWCFFSRPGRRARAIGIVFLCVLGMLLANPHTKAEYMAAAYPLLFACGGVAIAALRRPWRPMAIGGLAALLLASGCLLAPLAMPLLPVDRYLAYARTLGVAPATAEGKQLDDLPQFFADMHGWEELARSVSRVYLTIPEPERRTSVAFVHNYGEAGALELYARRYPLPRVICNHNAYWYWGVGKTPITTFIRLGGAREDYFESYREVTPAGVHACPHVMPYENHLNIFIARHRRVPIESAWGEYKHFD